MLNSDLTPLDEDEHWAWPSAFCPRCIRRYNLIISQKPWCLYCYFYNDSGFIEYTRLVYMSPRDNNRVYQQYILNPALLKYEISIQARNCADGSISFEEFVDNCQALRARLEAPR